MTVVSLAIECLIVLYDLLALAVSGDDLRSLGEEQLQLLFAVYEHIARRGSEEELQPRHERGVDRAYFIGIGVGAAYIEGIIRPAAVGCYLTLLEELLQMYRGGL